MTGNSLDGVACVKRCAANVENFQNIPHSLPARGIGKDRQFAAERARYRTNKVW